jgi:hypothetical protein
VLSAIAPTLRAADSVTYDGISFIADFVTNGLFVSVAYSGHTQSAY